MGFSFSKACTDKKYSGCPFISSAYFYFDVLHLCFFFSYMRCELQAAGAISLNSPRIRGRGLIRVLFHSHAEGPVLDAEVREKDAEKQSGP